MTPTPRFLIGWRPSARQPLRRRRSQARPPRVRFDPDLRSKIIDTLDAKWRWLNLEGWQDHYRSSREDRQLLRDLEEKARHEALNSAERLKHAKLAEQFLGEEQAVSLYRESVAADPDNAQARFDLGRLLIDGNDAEGLPLLEAAMTIDDRFTMVGCELAFLYMMRAGRATEAEAYRRRLVDQRELEERAAEERAVPALARPL